MRKTWDTTITKIVRGENYLANQAHVVASDPDANPSNPQDVEFTLSVDALAQLLGYYTLGDRHVGEKFTLTIERSE